jgi:hypothetical protein
LDNEVLNLNVVSQFSGKSLGVREESLSIYFNITQKGTKEQVAKIFEDGYFRSIIDKITINDPADLIILCL